MRSERLWLLAATAWLASACGQGGGYAGGIQSYAYYVYVTNQSAATISAFSVLGSGNLVPGSEISSGGNQPVGIVIHPSMSYLYALNAQATGSSGSSIGVFSISPANGSLSQVAVSSLPSSCGGLAIDPGGRFVYAACDTVIATLTVENGGASLSGLQTLTLASGIAEAVQADPSGSFVYATNESQAEAMSYSVSTTGALSLISTAATDTSPVAVAVDPQGRFIVTANIAKNDVTMLSVAASSGTLTSIGSYGVGSGTEPKGVAVDPTGSFVYVTATQLDTLNSFAVQSNFSLVSLASYNTDLLPSALAFSPDGAFLAVANSGASNDVFLFNYEAGGTLTFSDEGAADSQPSGVAIAKFLAPAAL